MRAFPMRLKDKRNASYVPAQWQFETISADADHGVIVPCVPCNIKIFCLLDRDYWKLTNFILTVYNENVSEYSQNFCFPQKMLNIVADLATNPFHS